MHASISADHRNLSVGAATQLSCLAVSHALQTGRLKMRPAKAAMQDYDNDGRLHADFFAFLFLSSCVIIFFQLYGIQCAVDHAYAR